MIKRCHQNVLYSYRPGCWMRQASTRLLRMWFLRILSTGQRQVGQREERSIQPEQQAAQKTCMQGCKLKQNKRLKITNYLHFGGHAEKALQDHKVGFKLPTLKICADARVLEILPDTVMQQVLTDNTRQALLHLVRLRPSHCWFRQTTSLSCTVHFRTGGVWQVQIITFICQDNNCILHAAHLM